MQGDGNFVFVHTSLYTHMFMYTGFKNGLISYWRLKAAINAAERNPSYAYTVNLCITCILEMDK